MQPSALAQPTREPLDKDVLEKGGASSLLERARSLMGPMLVFALTLAIALWQHFETSELRCTFFSDSRHYLETCQQILLFINNQRAGLASPALLGPGGALSASLMMDGPILPLMPAFYFLLVGKVPAQVDWQPFVVMQSLVHALSASLIFILMRKLTNSRKWAFGAGMLWGLYPGAIAATGRFLTEVPAALFLLLLVWSASRLPEALADPPFDRSLKGLGLGFWSGVILLFKPALLPVWLGVNAIDLAMSAGWKLRVQLAASVLAGMCLVVVPWALCSKAMTGQVYLTAQRAPVYNIAKGCDTDADGWGALPEAPLTQYLSESPDVLSTMLISLKSHPAELMNMSLRKVARLWSAPWNDFRISVLGLPASWQQWCQWLLLILAAPGALAVVCGLPARTLPTASWRPAAVVGYSSILVILGHLAYVPFEAITRYGFTAMPFVVLLAAFGGYAVLRLPAHRKVALAFTGALLALTLVVECVDLSSFVSITGDFRLALLAKLACESLFVVGALLAALKYAEGAADEAGSKLIARTGAILACCGIFAILLAFCLDGRSEREWSCKLAPGDSACRLVNLAAIAPAPRKEPALAAVLIDADSSIKNAIVSVNGHQLHSLPESLLRFRPVHYFLFDIMRIMAAKLGLPVDEIRQWRVVMVPVKFLNLRGPNEIRLVNSLNGSVTLYGDYQDRWTHRRHLPEFDYFSSGMFCNSLSGLEGRLLDPVGLPQMESSCWKEHKGARGAQAGEYRMFLLLNFQQDSHASTGAAVKFVKQLKTTDFDPQLSRTFMPGADLRINKAILKTVSRLDCPIDVPESARAATYLRVTISGFVRASGRPCKVSLLPTIIGGGKPAYSTVLPATPPYLNAGPDWKRFEISDIVPPAKLPGVLKTVSIALLPGRWEETWEYGCSSRSGDACFRDLRIEFEPVSRPILDGTKLAVY